MAGKSSKGAERLLKLRGNSWWFRRQVPKAARLALDREWLLVNLQTSDVVRATGCAPSPLWNGKLVSLPPQGLPGSINRFAALHAIFEPHH
ncbi:hypothetical protein SAMN05877809_10119 [Rhodobacter sp. JA431]|uniref:hypothetical protein n=1 Tax=Rhodobacter sp. JA431 TaxID=570013 RepID=UPI000BD5FEA8|nr:hypothetical protein [Rhodobacter sp. JA431]SOB89506.1 hypothetical protein SAMN05877809_10119 [Rhodobacter sp. JA431]